MKRARKIPSKDIRTMLNMVENGLGVDDIAASMKLGWPELVETMEAVSDHFNLGPMLRLARQRVKEEARRATPTITTPIPHENLGDLT